MANIQRNSGTLSLTSTTVQSLKIFWKKQNYFSLPFTPEFAVDSPCFTFSKGKWCLRLYPNGQFSTVISLVRLHSLETCQKIICKFSVLVGETEYFDDEVYCRFHYECNGDIVRNGDIPSRSTLFTNQKTLPGGTLVVKCHLISEESSEVNHISETCKINSNKTLCQDFENLLLNAPDHDLILKVRGKEFPVHQNILKARSRVFESMLTHNMVEKSSGVVDVPDCDPQAMKQFLLYVYSGNVYASNESNTSALYYIADKYNMLCLKEECRVLLRNLLTCSNFCDVVRLALNHSDDTLLEYATNFFTNNTSDIIVTPEWVSFLKENALAANNLYIKASKKWVESTEKKAKRKRFM